MSNRTRIQLACLFLVAVAVLLQQLRLRNLGDDLAQLEAEVLLLGESSKQTPIASTIATSEAVSESISSLSDKPRVEHLDGLIELAKRSTRSADRTLVIEEIVRLDESLVPRIVEQMAMDLADSGNFDQASAFVEAYLPYLAAYPEKLYAIARIHIDRDSATKLAWLLEITPPEARPINQAGFIKAWTKVDFNAAARHLTEMPAGEARDQATSTFVQTIAGHEPEAAMAWAHRIENPKSREEALASIRP